MALFEIMYVGCVRIRCVVVLEDRVALDVATRRDNSWRVRHRALPRPTCGIARRCNRWGGRLVRHALLHACGSPSRPVLADAGSFAVPGNCTGSLIADDAHFGGRGRPAFLLTTERFLQVMGLAELPAGQTVSP